LTREKKKGWNWGKQRFNYGAQGQGVAEVPSFAEGGRKGVTGRYNLSRPGETKRLVASA